MLIALVRTFNLATVLLIGLLVCASPRSFRNEAGPAKAQVTPLPIENSLGAPSREIRDDILEAVFRHMCRPEPIEKEVSHNVNRAHKVYFFGVGEKMDPPAEFLSRFKDISVPVKPISEGEWKEFYIYDRATGKRGAASYVNNIAMLSKDEAEVEAVLHPGGGLSASGPIYHLKRKSGKWAVIASRLKWIS
jgi:hypothetical protein